MYKTVSKFLIFVLLGFSVFGYAKYRQWGKERKNLRNKIAESEVMRQETDTAFSRLAVESEDLKSKNKELQRVINDRDEEVLALSNANLKLRDRLIKVKNAKQVVVDKDGNVVKNPDPTDSTLRYRVDFDHEEDPLRVSGFTLTNPPYAEVSLKWTRDLSLEIILTKDDDGFYRVYLDSENSDVVPTELKLQVDPKILELKWYEKIALGTDLGLGKKGLYSLFRLTYDVGQKYYIGPNILFTWTGKDYVKYYGLSFGWYMFR